MKKIMKIDLVLYSTAGCHLCESALAVLLDVGRLAQYAGPDIVLDEIDIATQDGLMARYGARIPVLRNNADGRELDWPFDVQALSRFLTGEKV
jgi:hypothetical protein